MFQTFKNAWKVPDLRKKIIFTLIILALYRIGASLFVPYVNTDAMAFYSENTLNAGIFSFVNLISGDAFSKATLFALSVSPYITASIVMQLLTIAIPALERISKDGEAGKKRITKYTRWVTIALSLITAYGYVKMLESGGVLLIAKSTEENVSNAPYYFGMIVMIACFCAGAALVMWLAEQINAYGIGNGISMILFANILATFAGMIQGLINMVKDPLDITGQTFLTGGALVGGIVKIVLFVALTLAAILLIVWFTNSERRIPIQYAKRVVGRKMYGGQTSNLPLKMNMAGVMPVIFATSIIAIPATVASFVGGDFAIWMNQWAGPTSVLYLVLLAVLIFAFSYFYIMISFNPVEVANNIRSNGGAIPGIRPGKPTSDYIKKVLNRITLIGALFLIVIAVVPYVISAVCGLFGITDFNLFTFVGTSLLIVVGVALETVRDLEAQLAMRNYKGFLD